MTDRGPRCPSRIAAATSPPLSDSSPDDSVRRVTLSTGRQISFAEYGHPDGMPFIFMHGIPSSRLAGRLIDDAAHGAGIRVIAPDRPGYGFSTHWKERRILDWPRDVSDLADQLGLDCFGLIGVSGAAPYLLGCTLVIPDRLTHVAILSGMGPLDAPGVLTGMNRESAALYRLALRSPRLGRLWMKMLGQTAKHSPGLVFEQQLSYLSPADQAVFQGEAMRELRIADLAEAFRQGADGAGLEAVLYVSDWGFRLSDVAANVFLWRGAQDRHHPPAMGSHMSAMLPRNRTVVSEQAGGFGFVTEMDSIIEAILAYPISVPRPAGRS